MITAFLNPPKITQIFFFHLLKIYINFFCDKNSSTRKRQHDVGCCHVKPTEETFNLPAVNLALKPVDQTIRFKPAVVFPDILNGRHCQH